MPDPSTTHGSRCLFFLYPRPGDLVVSLLASTEGLLFFLRSIFLSKEVHGLALTARIGRVQFPRAPPASKKDSLVASDLMF